MNKLQEKLEYLLDKYEIPVKAEISEDGKTLKVNGNEYTLMSWRNERRYIELKKIVETTVGGLSHFKVMSINPNTVSLDDVIKREIDTAEYIGGFKITDVFMAQNGNTCSILCATDDGCILTLELATTLPAGSEVVDKHEIITDRGTCCDRNVDSQTPLSSVYVYGADKAEFTDVDFELYGLSIPQIAAVRRAFDIVKNNEMGNSDNSSAKRLDLILAAAKKSADENVNVAL